jgi:hypothetical protein
MAGTLAGLSPASLLVALLMVAGGGLMYATPARRYRTLGQAGLALGWALATGRYLGAGPGLAVGAVGLLAAWLLDGGEEAPVEPLGVPMRLLLALFAAIAAAALVVGRPLGAASALDANAAWYWSGALGLLLLLSERGARSTARGGGLVVAAGGLALLQLAPGPPVALLLAGALLLLGLAAAGRPRPLLAGLAAERSGLLVDALLAAVALGLLVGLANRGVAVGETTFTLGAAQLPVAVAAAVLGLGLAAHARWMGLAGSAGPAWGALAAALPAVLALSAGSPAVAGVLAAAVPVALVLGRAAAGDPPAAGTSALLLVGAAAGISASALGLVELYQASATQPGLARVGLALALLHAGLLGAIAPAHLWALGVWGHRDGESAERLPAASMLAAGLGLGSLAALGAVGGAAVQHEWLLAVAGARPLVVGVALLGMVAAGVAILAEERIGRLVVQVGALAGGLALMVLASAEAPAVPAAQALLADRALALALALAGVDALARARIGRGATTGERLCRPDLLPLWVGLCGLIGLPPVGAYAARLHGLAAVAADRPELVAVALAAGVLGLVGMKRVADAVVSDAVEGKGKDERPTALRRSVPLVLCGLYLAYQLV